MASLDRIIFVPIERPDRIYIPKAEGRELRRCVDERLRELLLEDRLGFGSRVLEAAGPLEDRVRMVQDILRRT
jgi:hypothetical protein